MFDRIDGRKVEVHAIKVSISLRLNLPPDSAGDRVTFFRDRKVRKETTPEDTFIQMFSLAHSLPQVKSSHRLALSCFAHESFLFVS